jgi:predicted RNA methylase
LGRHERTAAQLAPVLGVVVERADPQASERVLDLGCGTGNAALLAAARGASVTAVDPHVDPRGAADGSVGFHRVIRGRVGKGLPLEATVSTSYRKPFPIRSSVLQCPHGPSLSL